MPNIARCTVPIPAAWCLLVSLLSCQHQPPPKPVLILWAWDRLEDLTFLQPGEAELAGLLGTITLINGEARVEGRRLPLKVPPAISILGVVRLESDGSALPDAARVAQEIRNLTSRPRVSGIQIDFDARASQLGWYKQLLKELGPVSMTALASWCLDKPWFAGPDVREAAPMLFRMGPQQPQLLRRLRRQGQFAPGCPEAIGISTDEPMAWLPPAPRVYVFHPKPWTEEAFRQVCARF